MLRSNKFHKFSMGFKSGDYGGGYNTFGQLYNKYSCTIRDLCFGSLS